MMTEIEHILKRLRYRAEDDRPDNLTSFEVTVLVSAIEENQRLRDEKLIWAKWIVEKTPPLFKDHACLQCCPDDDPEYLEDGFVCVYHEARQALEGDWRDA
jgi:hypothetical protein